MCTHLHRISQLGRDPQGPYPKFHHYHLRTIILCTKHNLCTELDHWTTRRIRRTGTKIPVQTGLRHTIPSPLPRRHLLHWPNTWHRFDLIHPTTTYLSNRRTCHPRYQPFTQTWTILRQSQSSTNCTSSLHARIHQRRSSTDPQDHRLSRISLPLRNQPNARQSH